MSAASPSSDSSGELLDQLLVPLLQDYADSFERGLVLLEHCPELVLADVARQALRERLELAQGELAAARALRAAAPVPMALDMATIRPWHQLMVEVWSFSSALRAVGIRP